jgi:hypothetical protein
MLEVAEAGLERLCLSPGVPQIARRARRRERSGVPGFTMAARVRRTRPSARIERFSVVTGPTGIMGIVAIFFPPIR